jgi:hypothetical protein
MTGADKAIRYSTIAAVSVVAIIAAVVTAVIQAHGESGVIARNYARTIDGLIYAASMALLDAFVAGRSYARNVPHRGTVRTRPSAASRFSTRAITPELTP